MDKINTDNEFFLSELKQRIRLKIGFMISAVTDCYKLSEAISNEGLPTVSGITLYRIFIKYNNTHKPYKSTYQVLSKYIGYNNWEEFIDDVKKKHSLLHQPLHDDYKNQNKSLIYHCLQQECYSPLESYFESIEDFEHDLKFDITLDVYDSLLKLNNTIPFFKYFAKNKFIRNYLFEYGFDPVFRIKDYDKGFDLYADGIKPDKTELDLRDYIFSFSVLLRHYYFRKEYAKSLKIARKLYYNTTYIDQELEGIYIFPRMRFQAYRIWYMQMKERNKKVIEQYVEELLDYCKSIYAKQDETERKITYYVMAETFLHSKIKTKYHDALKTIFAKEFNTIPSIIFDKSLSFSLPYFESNGLLFHRPL